MTVQRAFYYWKADEDGFKVSEIKAVDTLQVKKLYVKFFEVEQHRLFGARPISKTNIHFNFYYGAHDDSVLSRLEIVPVVFVKTEVLVQATNEGLDSLADNILFLVQKKFKEHTVADRTYNEVQIDCDWTAGTKDKYFYLLKALRKQTKKTLSCTLRLYPYKYPNLMGVPPVDKAMLMCYNLNNPLAHDDKNSILDPDELKKYLTKNVYPLHLDIALPVNSWMLCFQNDRFAGILHDVGDIRNFAIKENPLWYRVATDTVINNIYLRSGDRIKYEEVTPDQLEKTLGLLKDRIRFTGTTTVSFFHLDEQILKKYNNETLDGLYRAAE
ncbi:hypothetical protein [Ferruginibacter sp.]